MLGLGLGLKAKIFGLGLGLGLSLALVSSNDEVSYSRFDNLGRSCRQHTIRRYSGP